MKKVSIIKKSEVLKVLRKNGYKPCRLSEVGYSFVSDQYVMLYLTLTDETSTLIFSIPKIYIFPQGEGREVIRELINDFNSSVLEVKFTIMGDQVWANYEYYLIECHSIELIIPHIINQLKSAVGYFHEKIQNF